MTTTHVRQRCVVIGAGGHARAVTGVLMEPWHRARYELIVVLDEQPPRYAGESLAGVPVETGLARVDELAANGCAVFLAIGDNLARARLFARYRAAGYQMPNLVSERAVVSSTAKLGIANFVAPLAHVGPLAALGHNNLINTQANVEHDAELGDSNHIAPGATVLGRAAIGNGCLIGSRAVVLERLRVADGSTVGAGAVVTRSVDVPGAKLVGVPARGTP